ncbi:MAG TPA: thiamine-phosphate kinase, partial [Erythrobacter sp.]|nr:thiamine-phosphate kinase [Erythrobacter sp.]
ALPVAAARVGTVTGGPPGLSLDGDIFPDAEGLGYRH